MSSGFVLLTRLVPNLVSVKSHIGLAGASVIALFEARQTVMNCDLTHLNKVLIFMLYSTFLISLFNFLC